MVRTLTLTLSLLHALQLYREFAEPLAMLEVKLMIFHVSEHRDLELVKETWQALLDEGERPSLRSSFCGLHVDLSVHCLFLNLAHANGPRGCRYEGVANAVLELGKRLFPSEVAAPIGECPVRFRMPDISDGPKFAFQALI